MIKKVRREVARSTMVLNRTTGRESCLLLGVALPGWNKDRRDEEREREKGASEMRGDSI